MPEQPRMLVVDDHSAVHVVLKRVFGDRGFAITLVDDIQKAHQQVQNNTFDIVLLDLMLPGGNGIDFLRYLRQHFPRIPVIIMSGMQQEVIKQQAAQEGAAGYLVKPFQIDEVVALVYRILE